MERYCLLMMIGSGMDVFEREAFWPGHSRQGRCKAGPTPVQGRSRNGFAPGLIRSNTRFGPLRSRGLECSMDTHSIGHTN